MVMRNELPVHCNPESVLIEKVIFGAKMLLQFGYCEDTIDHQALFCVDFSQRAEQKDTELLTHDFSGMDIRLLRHLLRAGRCLQECTPVHLQMQNYEGCRNPEISGYVFHYPMSCP